MSSSRFLTLSLRRQAFNFGPGGAQATKHSILRPQREDHSSVYEDLSLYQPKPSELYRATKEAGGFLPYLKVVCTQENRMADYQAYVDQLEGSKLVCESDVYLTVDEVLALMWRHGFSVDERNALQFALPKEAHLHYPEVAVLFGLAPDETYQFCLKARTDKHHIGELKLEAVKPQGLIRSHWLVYFTGICAFAHFPWYNYAFMFKTFGTSLWFYTNWRLFSQSINAYNFKNAFIKKQKVVADKLDGEDQICATLKGMVAHEGLLTHLEGVEPESQKLAAQLEAALVRSEIRQMTLKVQRQLDLLWAKEREQAGILQNRLVSQVVTDVEASITNSKSVQASILGAGLASLQDASLEFDPLKPLLLEGVAAYPQSPAFEGVQQELEAGFAETFRVSQADKELVATLKARGSQSGAFAVSSLSAEDQTQLEAVYDRVHAKLGYHLPIHFSASQLEASEAYGSQVAREAQAAQAAVVQARMDGFVAQF